MSDLLVGVDIGTTKLKVGVFDAEGNLCALAVRDCALDRKPGGRLFVDADRWMRDFEAAFDECLTGVNPEAIRAIGFSSQAQTYVFVDDAGEPLEPAVSWLDATGDGEGAAAALAGEDFHAHTGWARVGPSLTLCKLRRYAREDSRSQAARLLFPEGFLACRLTGRMTVSRNIAAMSGLYSLPRRDWWPKALDAASIQKRLLPELRDFGELVGPVQESLWTRWGTGPVSVVAGANDQTAAALGAGLAGPGDAMLAIGTAMVLYQVIPPEAPPTASRPHRGEYPGGLHYQLGLWSTGCAVLEWARRLWAPETPWDDLFDEALRVPLGAEGLRVCPEFNRGGTLNGLTLRHDRACVMRALIEGLACAARRLLDDLSVEGRVLVTGGGALHDGVMQLFADIVGRPLARVEEPQASVRGAAILAGAGAGVYPDVLAASGRLRKDGRVFSPSPDLRDPCDALYRDFLELRPDN